MTDSIPDSAESAVRRKRFSIRCLTMCRVVLVDGDEGRATTTLSRKDRSYRSGAECTHSAVQNRGQNVLTSRSSRGGTTTPNRQPAATS